MSQIICRAGGESNQIIFENAASVCEPEPESQIIY